MRPDVQQPQEPSIARISTEHRPEAVAAGVTSDLAPSIVPMAPTSIPVGNGPFGVAVAPNGNAYVANEGGANVTVIDTATDTVIGGPIPVGSGPRGVAVASNGNVYVTNFGTNDVTVIDSATNTVLIASLPVGIRPWGVAVAPNGNAYIADYGANTVTVIDTTTNTVVGSPIAVSGSGPSGVTVAPNGNVYVSKEITNDVTVIDSSTNTVLVPSIVVGTTPFQLWSAPNGKVFVADYGANNVTVIDSATNTVVGSPIPVGTGPFGGAVTPGGMGYAVNNVSNDVTVFDTATGIVVIPSIAVGLHPDGAAVVPGNKVYVANRGPNSVSVIPFPTLTGISPSQGPVAGGTVVTITGTNLTGAGVTIGGNAATNVTVNPGGTQITATTPAGTPGPADVTVTTTGIDILTGGFTYVAGPPLTGISPGQGTTAGGTIVTIGGHDLAPATAVRFGDTPATILADTATVVTVKSPAGWGAVPVTVTTPGGTADFGTFCYLPAPLLAGITTISNPDGGAGPAMGPYTGGGTAVITGVNLSGTTSVRFGSGLATLQSVTDTALTVGIPGVPSPGPAPVTVITAGESAGGLTFTYLDVPTLTDVSPGTGPTGGGTDVTVTGNHLTTTQNVAFDNIPVPFTVISDQALTATAPPHPASGDVTLKVTTLGGSSQSTYTYLDGPAV
ncbi:IPT/TIG domain-containing protein [Kitasatospora sp. NPDC004669]|uniref:IPT/TIG domain-containing protein n=1 Tax=Kitasatospora sp. NPDC004669 TaxID=3154555 RepID=UPI0033BF77CE